VRDIELVEVEPNKWRVKRKPHQLARSNLPRPYVISDIMEPTEQVDGKFYTSKRAFRATGRALGLTEVGNEKFKPKVRGSIVAAQKRRETIGSAISQYKAGRRLNRKTGE
jgi:hypothetical protein